MVKVLEPSQTCSLHFGKYNVVGDLGLSLSIKSKIIPLCVPYLDSQGIMLVKLG